MKRPDALLRSSVDMQKHVPVRPLILCASQESGCRLIALRQENQPHELQHRSDEVDDDSSKKRNRHDPDAKEWEEQHPIHPFEFGWSEAARCLEVEDRERNLAKLGPSRYTNAKWIRAAALLSAGKSQ